MSEKFEEKKKKTQNCEISHINRINLDAPIYIERQNIINVWSTECQGDLNKLLWHDRFGRTHVYTAVSGKRVGTRPRGCLGRTLVYMAMWTFRTNACVHGRVDIFGWMRVYTAVWTSWAYARVHYYVDVSDGQRAQYMSHFFTLSFVFPSLLLPQSLILISSSWLGLLNLSCKKLSLIFILDHSLYGCWLLSLKDLSLIFISNPL